MVHPVIGAPNRPASLNRIFSDPMIILNIVLRGFLFYLAAFNGHWHSGDSNHYLLGADAVCKGEWGGESSYSHWTNMLPSDAGRDIKSCGTHMGHGALRSQTISERNSACFVSDDIKKANSLPRLVTFKPKVLRLFDRVLID